MTLLEDGRRFSVAPERSHSQRMTALAGANRIRLARAQLKRDLKAGRVNVVDVLLEPAEWAEGMRLYDLMLATPRYGQVKVNKILRDLVISPAKTVGGLSRRQRVELELLVRR